MWRIVFVICLAFLTSIVVFSIGYYLYYLNTKKTAYLLSVRKNKYHKSLSDLIDRLPYADVMKKHPFLQSVWSVVFLLVIFVAGVYFFKNPVPALLCTVTFGIIPLHIIVQKKRARRGKVIEQFTAAIQVFIGEYSRTAQTLGSIQAVANKISDPVGGIFKKAYKDIVFGADSDLVYRRLAKELDTPFAFMFIKLLQLSKKMGVGVVPLMYNLLSQVREHQKLHKLNSTEVAGDRKIAFLTASIPIPLYLVVQTKYPPAAQFFNSTVTGKIIVSLCFLSVIVWFIIDNILADE